MIILNDATTVSPCWTWLCLVGTLYPLAPLKLTAFSFWGALLLVGIVATSASDGPVRWALLWPLQGTVVDDLKHGTPVVGAVDYLSNSYACLLAEFASHCRD